MVKTPQTRLNRAKSSHARTQPRTPHADCKTAGTGKSFLLRYIIRRLKEAFGHPGEFCRKVAVTAATGIAATHIGGTTLHSAMGCGVTNSYPDFGRMFEASNAQRLRELDVSLGGWGAGM